MKTARLASMPASFALVPGAAMVVLALAAAPGCGEGGAVQDGSRESGNDRAQTMDAAGGSGGGVGGAGGAGGGGQGGGAADGAGPRTEAGGSDGGAGSADAGGERAGDTAADSGRGADAAGGGDAGTDAGGTGALRDPCRWPFAKTSIWNTPLGAGAAYVPGRIKEATEHGMTTDPDLIVLAPTAPMTDVYYNGSGWSGRDRCPREGDVLLRVPLPASFVVPSGPGTPNNGLAVLMPDGHTVKQTQPFSRCTAGAAGTSMYVFADNDLFTDGIRGSHGGSGMTAIGGTLRIGELRPGKHPPRHALKGNVFARMNLFRCTRREDCFRWPAATGDGYAVGSYGTGRDGVPAAMKMGVLLALPPDATAASLGLETEPARQLLWTLQSYGMYIVDDTAWDVYAIETEQGPGGDFAAQFRSDWGFDIAPQSRDVPWARDMRRIFTNLHAVDNNGAASVGGGGAPRVALAPDLASACGSGVGASD